MSASCTSLEVVNGHYDVPSTWTIIPNNCFESVDELQTITIHNAVTAIGESAFRGCRGLTSICIPSSVQEVGSSAFRSCDNLTRVSIGSRTIGSFAFYKNPLLIEVVFRNGTEVIGDGAFQLCPSLKKPVVLPGSIRVINESAFSSCTSLDSVTFSKSAYVSTETVSIGSNAFADCSRLVNINIPTSASFGANPFTGCGCPEPMFVAGAVFCDCEDCTGDATPPTSTISSSLQCVESPPTSHPLIQGLFPPIDTMATHPSHAPSYLPRAAPSGDPTKAPSDAEMDVLSSGAPTHVPSVISAGVPSYSSTVAPSAGHVGDNIVGIGAIIAFVLVLLVVSSIVRRHRKPKYRKETVCDARMPAVIAESSTTEELVPPACALEHTDETQPTGNNPKEYPLMRSRLEPNELQSDVDNTMDRATALRDGTTVCGRCDERTRHRGLESGVDPPGDSHVTLQLHDTSVIGASMASSHNKGSREMMDEERRGCDISVTEPAQTCHHETVRDARMPAVTRESSTTEDSDRAMEMTQVPSCPTDCDRSALSNDTVSQGTPASTERVRLLPKTTVTKGKSRLNSLALVLCACAREHADEAPLTGNDPKEYPLMRSRLEPNELQSVVDSTMDRATATDYARLIDEAYKRVKRAFRQLDCKTVKILAEDNRLCQDITVTAEYKNDVLKCLENRGHLSRRHKQNHKTLLKWLDECELGGNAPVVVEILALNDLARRERNRPSECSS